MQSYIGEVTLQKTNIVTNEVTEQTENNTQLWGMFYNLSLQSNPAFVSSSNQNNPIIYISDNTQELTRLTYNFTDGLGFNIGGATISGEFWPQYKIEPENNRSILTYKRRFQPPASGSGSRTINTIALYSPSTNAYMAALKLQTPCIQSELEILDVFYKIYIYYDAASLTPSPNSYTTGIIANGIINRWFYNSGANVYAEGTSSLITTFASSWSDALGLIPTNMDLEKIPGATYIRDTYTDSYYWQYPSTTTFTNTNNISQGTTMKSLTMATTAWIGTLVNKMAVMRWDYGVDASYYVPYSAVPVLPSSNTNYVQSVYLKNAASKTYNFAYLDPSSIGSSTATLALDSSGWTQKFRPSLMRIDITTGGSISTAKYKVSVRNAFGFASNLFSTEYNLPFNNVLRKYGSRAAVTPYTNNNWNNSTLGDCVSAINQFEVVSSGKNAAGTAMGISIINPYTNDFINYDNTTTPALNSNAIQLVKNAPDGSILIATTDAGLLRLSVDRTTITKFTTIGAGVNADTCYCFDVKHNGDIWAMFEGGLAKFTFATSTWAIYNSSSTPAFTPSEYNPTWSNTLAIYCRKDSAADELALIRQNAANLTWWSPANPTPVTPTNASSNNVNKFNQSTARAAYATPIMINVPGSSTWYFVNSAGTMARFQFGGTTVSNTISSGYSSSYRTALRAVKNGSTWAIRSLESISGNGKARNRLFDAAGLLSDEANTNSLTSTYGYNNQMIDLMDDYGTALICQPANITTSNNTWLMNTITPLSDASWESYGWDAGTSTWSKTATDSKPVHTGMEDLPFGIKCKFTPTGTNDFITGERWEVYLYDGFHKDNSTNAILNVGVHARDSYTTSDISTSTVPATAYGTTTEKFSTYTLTDDHYSWNGMVSALGTASNTVAASLRSELIATGDFTLNFNSNKVANTTSSASVAYVSFYERDAVTPSSKWGFQFRGDGYVVAEDDVAKTTRILTNGTEKFTIKRTGNTITYLVNDVLVYTSTITSTLPLRGMIRMPSGDNQRLFYGMSLTYNESRNVVRIGSAVNQTGIYDSRYAMVEAWLTNPRSMVVTIAGVAATIITDPMVAPLAGQVLVLQKSGMLVFNSADAGKAVTCSSLILLET